MELSQGCIAKVSGAGLYSLTLAEVGVVVVMKLDLKRLDGWRAVFGDVGCSTMMEL